MSDKLLYENLMLNEEAGFDGQTAATLGTTVDTGTEGDTNTTDIARTAPKVGYAHSVASKTLPATLGYVQPLSSPAGFIFAMKNGPAVNQTPDMPFLNDGSGNPAIGTSTADDLQITRTPVNTGMREVKIDVTNEVAQDIESLFGEEFEEFYQSFLYYDGTDVDFRKEFEGMTDFEMKKFFMEYATWKMSRKTNTDFVTWLGTVATDMGAYDVAAADDIQNIKAVVAELKSKLYETGKTGRTWVVASPKIINYLLSKSTTCIPDNDIANAGKRRPSAFDFNYVFTCGEIDYYQDINITDKMYAGIIGTAGESSVFYTPYKEYFVQGGEDYYTGQSNIWFRLRDAWALNPLDNGSGANDSDFIVSADITFSMGTLLT